MLFEIFKVPELGVSIKESKFKSVDLPEPDGPINEYIFPDLNIAVKEVLLTLP